MLSGDCFFVVSQLNTHYRWCLWEEGDAAMSVLPPVFFTSNTHTMVFKMTLFDTQAVTVHVNSIGGTENALSVLFLVTYVMIIPPPDQ